MNVCFCNKPLKKCPIVFCIMEPEVFEEPEKICPERVVVLGPGLMSAYCNEEAEFIVDGSNAGPGKSLYTVYKLFFFFFFISSFVFCVLRYD